MEVTHLAQSKQIKAKHNTTEITCSAKSKMKTTVPANKLFNTLFCTLNTSKCGIEDS